MKNKLIAFILLVFSFQAIALDCNPEKVVLIQVQQDNILVKLENQNWHLLGLHSSPATKAMYSAVLAAQMAEKRVSMRFPGGYDCSAYEVLTAPSMVRVWATD